MKRIIAALFIVCVALTISVPADAKTTTRYATKTVAIKEKCSNKADTVCKVKVNTKLKVVKEWKRWVKVDAGGKVGYTKKIYLHAKRSANKYRPKQFKRRGVIRWQGTKWTWYTQRRLPGRGLKIPGRHVDKKTGYVLDKDGYIVLASSVRNKKKRLIVPTPYGRYGRVYDTNGKGPSNWRDVYTNW